MSYDCISELTSYRAHAIVNRSLSLAFLLILMFCFTALRPGQLQTMFQHSALHNMPCHGVYVKDGCIWRCCCSERSNYESHLNPVKSSSPHIFNQSHQQLNFFLSLEYCQESELVPVLLLSQYPVPKRWKKFFHLFWINQVKCLKLVLASKDAIHLR